MELKVGISSGWEPGQIVEGWPLVYTCKNLVEKVEKQDGLPFVLPVLDDPSRIDRLVADLDFIILSGEVLSIKRNMVEEHRSNVLRASNPLRYDNEAALVRAALAKDIPLLGICRGFQVLVAELGGVVGDEDCNEGSHIVHQQGKLIPPSKTVHAVFFQDDSRLRRMIGGASVMVNSFHRQPVRKVPPGFKVAALSEDGVIEAVEAEGDRLAFGFQFHPEIIAAPVWDRLFKTLFDSARKRKEEKGGTPMK